MAGKPGSPYGDTLEDYQRATRLYEALSSASNLLGIDVPADALPIPLRYRGETILKAWHSLEDSLEASR